MSADPFWWDGNEEDQVRAKCACGWASEWRDYYREVRSDENAHSCEAAAAWRATR